MKSAMDLVSCEFSLTFLTQADHVRPNLPRRIYWKILRDFQETEISKEGNISRILLIWANISEEI